MAEPSIWWAGTPNYTPGNYGIEALFPHWTCGGFDGSVATLQNPDRQASAHYVIEGGNVAQLVSEDDSAWHCGNYYYNMRAVSYELVGWPGNPPSYDTLDTCARMMADASRRYFGGARLVLGENVMLHQWVYATDCPGETDVEWLVNRANDYLEDDMAADQVWNYGLQGPNANMPAGQRLVDIQAKFYDRTDYSGRGKEVPFIERLCYMADKQDQQMEMQKQELELLKAINDNIAKLVKGDE